MSKAIIMFPMNDDYLQNKIFEGIEKYKLTDQDLHFLHVFEEVRYPYIVPPYIYPAENEKPKIKETVSEMMRNMAKAKLGDVADKFQYTCLFAENPKVGALSFLNNESFQTVVCATKEKGNIERFFMSSYTEHMIKHSPFDVLVLR